MITKAVTRQAPSRNDAAPIKKAAAVPEDRTVYRKAVTEYVQERIQKPVVPTEVKERLQERNERIERPAVVIQPEVVKKIEERKEITESRAQAEETKQPAYVEPEKTTNTDKMGWKPKTIAGKILKGAVIAGGSVLAVGAGVGAIGGAAAGVVKAGGIFKKIGKGIGGLFKKKGTAALTKNETPLSGNTGIDKLKESVGNLFSGVTAEQRKLVRAAKDEVRTDQQKIKTMQKLVDAGDDPMTALSKVGLSSDQVQELPDGTPLNQSSLAGIFQNKTVMIVLGILAAIFILPKLLKR